MSEQVLVISPWLADQPGVKEFFDFNGIQFEVSTYLPKRCEGYIVTPQMANWFDRVEWPDGD